MQNWLLTETVNGSILLTLHMVINSSNVYHYWYAVDQIPGFMAPERLTAHKSFVLPYLFDYKTFFSSLE